jgi:tetratricopeptide (TPR) repeat protein
MAIVVAGLVVYANSLRGPFTFDDLRSVVANEQIRHLWPISRVLALERQDQPASGRPLVSLSLTLNYAVGGLNVVGYHVANLAFHIVCGLLLFALVRRTLKLPAFASGIPDQTATVLGFASALIWTVHPLQTEAVDYISARTESLMAVFYLLTLYCSLRAATSIASTRWLLLAVTSCALGMASKEVMMTAPIVVLLYDRTFLFGSFSSAFAARWKLYVGLALSWALLALLLSSGARFDAAGFATAVTPWTYLLNQARLVVRYARLALWPRGLVFDYGVPQPVPLGSVLPQATLLASLILLTVVAARRRSALGFLGAWFFVILAPTSSIVPIATEVGAERRMYLPLAAIVTLVVIGGYRLAEGALRLRTDEARSQRTAASAPRGLRGSVTLPAIAVISSVILGIATVRRNAEYRSPLTLWTTVLERWPHPRAERNVAVELSVAGRHEEALALLVKATRRDPAVRYALAYELWQQGKLDDAIDEFREFVREYPDDDNAIHAHEMLANALAVRDRPAEAAAELREVLRVHPSDVAAQLSLADTLLARGMFGEARGYYEQVVRSKPGNGGAWTNLAVALAGSGRSAEAAEALRRAIEADPQSGRAHRDLAGLLLTSGDVAGAIRLAQEAVRLTPRDPAAHNLLGLALAAARRFDEAIAEFRVSLSVEPATNPAQQYLERVATLKRGGQPDKVRRRDDPGRAAHPD